ncbi:hypothetical protein [Mesorhizobium sp. BR1-1-14]|uniref:hypothetical protein n=1 Tax=Mesorhizobium sp. BR1-1-14 TaxID=2876655 RepID=UPI001CD08188|nr:hypothetical protein [Mesorhizobium sp. BR1-1-14]MBZ9957753.1 hypothetical protein [Mesorhizobium sp. BR1-1-14]
MAIVKEKLAHLWERDPNDFYVEPNECSRSLFRLETFQGLVWDPACGLGRIVMEARAAGLSAMGSDIIRRSELCEVTSDFLSRSFRPEFSNIVMNPPFSLAEEFVREAIDIVPQGGKVAAILPLVWLSGFSTKRDWLPHSPLKTVYPISPRPSMPPGRVIQAGIRPGNGTKDFSWLVWQKGYSLAPAVVFMNTNEGRKGKKARGGWDESAKQWSENERRRRSASKGYD